MSLSKMSPFSKLPNEVLSSVLNNKAMPLCRRLHLRLLTTRCCNVIENGLKGKSCLVIREEQADRQNRKPDDLIVKKGCLTDELIPILVRLFPAPTKLSIALGEWCIRPSPWSTVPLLLTHLDTTTLKTVQLYGDIGDPGNVRPIADALVGLSALTSLTLCLCLNSTLMPLLGPVLARLEKFACPDGLADYASLLSSSLSPRCTHLMLHQDVFFAFSCPFLAKLSASLTHLNLNGFSYHANMWQSLSQMHSLTSLALELKYSTLDSSLFLRLALLTRLTEVKLLNLSCYTSLALPSEKETPFPGIKRLTLGLNFFDEDQLDCQVFCQTISVWFPGLSQFSLIIKRGNIPAMQAQLPFSVEILHYTSVNC